MALKAPSKHLRYSETDFAGYWVQLHAVIRHNDNADQVLDGLLTNPLLVLSEMTEEHDLHTSLSASYEAHGYGFPPEGTFIDLDPIGRCIQAIQNRVSSISRRERSTTRMARTTRDQP